MADNVGRNLPLGYQSIRPQGVDLQRLETNVARVLQDTRTRILNNGLTLWDNLCGRLVQFKLTVPNPWTLATLSNGWVPFGGGFFAPQWRVDDDGNVIWRGMAKSGTVGAVTAASATSSAATPEGPEIFPVSSNHAFGSAQVTQRSPTGADIAVVTGSNAFVSFSGISYRPVSPVPPQYPLETQTASEVVLDASFPGQPSGQILVSVRADDGTAVGSAWPDIGVDKVGGLYRLRLRHCTGLSEGRTYTISTFILGTVTALPASRQGVAP